MRILFLTQYFPPEIGAPQVRIPELMREMIARGHDVTILTAMPNYPTGDVFTGYRGRITLRETLDGMRVARTWIYPTASIRLLPRTLSQVSFAGSSAALGAWLVPRPDVMLVGSPPLLLALSAVALGMMLRCPYVAFIADLWPEVAIETGALTHPLAVRAAYWMEKVFYRRALMVLTQTPGQAENIRGRFPDVSAHVVSGGVDTSLFSPDLRDERVRREYGVSGRIGVMYLGLHGFAQGLEVVLEAADRLRHRTDVRFVLVGNGVVKDDLVRRAAVLRLPNLTFYDPVARSRVPTLLASMDMVLVPLRKGVPRGTVPSKIYEAMASGVPIIVSADGESSDLVRGEAIGIAVETGNGGELAQSIARLADDPGLRAAYGRKGLSVARARFDRRMSAARLHELLLEHVITDRRAARNDDGEAAG